MEWARNNVLLWATDLELVPEEIKNQLSHISFTGKMKNWVSGICPCRLRETYLLNVGFV